MDLNTYLRPLIRWWRLILIVTVLALGASSISTLFQADMYVSRTTLITGTTFLDPNPDSGQLFIAQQLASIYADMALREPIQVATMDALGINWLPQYQARVVPNTQLVEISVIDTNPQRAQIIADELARQLILQSPTIGGTETGESQEFIRRQLDSLKVQIEDTQKNIEDLQKSLVGLTSASQIANIESDISEQTDKLNNLRTNYASFLANSQEGASNILSVLEPASFPNRPTNTSKFKIVFLAGLVGFSLGTGAAYLLEYLDRTIKTTSDVERIFNLPVIGYISEMPENANKATYVAKKPDSILAENFRLLRSNIEFFRLHDPIKTILVTSPSPGNGKTTVAANLALSISQAEQDVILVDADLRRPTVHTSLKMSMGPGLSDLIRSDADIESVERQWKGNANLKVITAGNKPANITEVIGSTRIATILSELEKNHEIIIIDSPPLVISDSYNLAARVDAVIIVMEPGLTTDEQANSIKEQLNRANANVVGFVFNKLTKENMHSYGDYRYRSLYSSEYYSNYTAEVKKESVTTSPSKKLIDFFENGKVPYEMVTEVEDKISAIKTQPRVMLKRIKKSSRNEKEKGGSNNKKEDKS